MSKILIVEDEENIRKFIKINLERSGFKVLEAETGEKGLLLAENEKPNLILLDIMLPGIDGIAVCTELRKKFLDIAIIMLTAKTQDMDKVIGLEMGADDYVTKPFNPIELIARINAVLRRTCKDKKISIIEINDIKIDLLGQKVLKDNIEVEVTNREFSLLKVFMENEGRAFRRDELLDMAWGKEFFGNYKTVDVHVRRLREKIEDNPSKPKLIETVWGYGYRFKKC